MRKMLYTTVPAAFLLSSCAALPGFLQIAAYDLEVAEEVIEAEEIVVEQINKGNDNAAQKR